MGKLVYGMMASLDGYISDANGKFEWGHVSEEVHRFAEAQDAAVGITIYGRRMFETMAIWDTVFEDQSVGQFERDYSLVWRANEKIVVSRSLDEVTTTNTRLVRELTEEGMAALKQTSEKDISVTGPTLAASFLNKGLVDEVSVYTIPVISGPGGTPLFPAVDRLIRLERLEQREFGNGVSFARYRVRND